MNTIYNEVKESGRYEAIVSIVSNISNVSTATVYSSKGINGYRVVAEAKIFLSILEGKFDDYKIPKLSNFYLYVKNVYDKISKEYVEDVAMRRLPNYNTIEMIRCYMIIIDAIENVCNIDDYWTIRDELKKDLIVH